MSAGETTWALRSYTGTRLLEIERAAVAFCGWDPRHDSRAAAQRFESATDALFEGMGTHPAQLTACEHFHGGAGEVQRFADIGAAAAGKVHLVSAPYDSLPASVRALPNGSDLVVTFATGSVATMALNWAAAARQAGIEDVLIGALDETMMRACHRAGVPCVPINGGAVSRELALANASNLRSRPSLYPKMSVLKVGFYRELLSFGFNVFACDADAVFVHDPRPLMRASEWREAHLAAATDCIDIPLDSRQPLLHCDLNTGMVFMRSSPQVLAFTERWREMIANSKEARIRDQASLNMLLKQRRLMPYRHRLFHASNGPDETIILGVLPLSRFLNGHTFFVQHAHTLPQAEPPLSVHLTYQFAEGAKFAYGKRQRLRQAGLWLVDDDDYYTGRYVSVSAETANLPVRTFGPNVDSRDAIKYHLEEARHRVKVLQTLLGIAKVLGRAVILPRMLCYCDFLWKEMRACRVGGATTMRLPFECPMDHALDTPKWFEELPGFGVTVREHSFLQNPRVPRNVSGSIARVELPKGLSDNAVRTLLATHSHAAVIEIADAADVFCGFTSSPSIARAFDDVRRRLLHYRRLPFCYEEGAGHVPGYSQCCAPRKPGDPFWPCMHGFDPPEALPICRAEDRATA